MSRCFMINQNRRRSPVVIAVVAVGFYICRPVISGKSRVTSPMLYISNVAH